MAVEILKQYENLQEELARLQGKEKEGEYSEAFEQLEKLKALQNQVEESGDEQAIARFHAMLEEAESAVKNESDEKRKEILKLEKRLESLRARLIEAMTRVITPFVHLGKKGAVQIEAGELTFAELAKRKNDLFKPDMSTEVSAMASERAIEYFGALSAMPEEVQEIVMRRIASLKLDQ